MLSYVSRTRAAGVNVAASEYPHLCTLRDSDGWVGPRSVEETYGAQLQPCPGNLRQMEDLSSDVFDASAVSPTIRAFFEQTSMSQLSYVGTERRELSFLHRLVRRFVTGRIGQLAIPAVQEGVRVSLESHNFGWDVDNDGVYDYRIWKRTLSADGSVFYTAALSTLKREWPKPGSSKPWTVRYFLLGFPLPRCNLSVVLMPRNLPNGGMELTSVEDFGPGFAGTYCVIPHSKTRLSYFRVPLREHFVFHSVEGSGFHVLHSEYLGKDALFHLDYSATAPVAASTASVASVTPLAIPPL